MGWAASHNPVILSAAKDLPQTKLLSFRKVLRFAQDDGGWADATWHKQAAERNRPAACSRSATADPSPSR